MSAIRRIAPAAAALLALAAPARAQTFTDVTVASGLSNPVDVQGVSWGDADGDGNPDVYLTLVLSPVLGVGNQLYQNELRFPGGPFAFFELGVAAGVAGDETSFGSAFADFDEDGDQDIVVANGANAALPNAVRLLVNDGTGHFVDEAAARGLGAPSSGRSVTWADYDDDGDVDLFLCTPDLVVFGERSYLFRNDGGTFTDVTAAAGLPTVERNTEAAAWADYDRDGDEDLFVSNHGVAPFQIEANELWQNQLVPTGSPTFRNVAPALGLADTGSSTGAAWGDCDEDGDLDLYVATGLDIFSIVGINAPNRLYRNDGAGGFAEIAGTAGVPGTDVSVRSQVSFSVAWGDLDNDGRLDLYVTNSRLNMSDPSNVVLRNVGNCRFEQVDAGADDPGSGQGTALADADRDGDLDVFVANVFSDSNVTARFYRNDSPARHWLIVDTEGVVSNRDGIGALVSVTAGGVTQVRHVHAGSGYLSQDSKEVEFGLGAATVVDRLEIRWPSGCVQVVPDPPVDALLRVVEDCLTGFDTASASDPDPCGTGLLVDWQPATFPSGTGHYEVRRGDTCAAAEAAPELLPRVAAPPFLDTGTTPNASHAYAILAVDDVNGASARACVAPVLDEDGTGAGPVVDPGSLRVVRDAVDDPVLSWTPALAGPFVVRRTLVRFDWAPGPDAVPIVGSPAQSPWTDAGLPLAPGEVAYYRVFGDGCP